MFHLFGKTERFELLKIKHISIIIKQKTLVSLGELCIFFAIMLVIVLSPNYLYRKFIYNIGFDGIIGKIDFSRLFLDMAYLSNIFALLLLYIGSVLIEKSFKSKKQIDGSKHWSTIQLVVPVLCVILIFYSYISCILTIKTPVSYGFHYPSIVRLYHMIIDSNLGLLITLESLLLVFLYVLNRDYVLRNNKKVGNGTSP